jgi:hypothetical protein
MAVVWRWIWVRVWVKERAAGAGKERGEGFDWTPSRAALECSIEAAIAGVLVEDTSGDGGGGDVSERMEKKRCPADVM